MKNDYIKHNKYGFGKIVYKKDLILLIAFLDYGIKKFKKPLSSKIIKSYRPSYKEKIRINKIIKENPNYSYKHYLKWEKDIQDQLMNFEKIEPVRKYGSLPEHSSKINRNDRW